MNPFPRLLGLTTLFLLLLLGAGLWAQVWLQRQGHRLRAEARQAVQERLAQAITWQARPVATWTDADLQAMSRLLGGTVERLPAGTPPPPSGRHLLVVDYPLSPPSAHGDLVLRVTVAEARSGPLLLNRWQTLLVLVALVVVVGVTIGWALLLWARPRPAETVNGALPGLRAEMQSLEQLARATVAQQHALANERGMRQRTEENLVFNQQLLTRAVEEKIRLGRDLHDGLIQSLYAAGLTIESTRGLLTADPAKADRQLEQVRNAINGTIRDVRNYIGELTEPALRRAGFQQTLAALLEELRTGRSVNFELHLDEEAATALTIDQSRELLQIIREAISNSLRHGQATLITLRLHLHDRTIGLLVHDNGAGFDPATGRDGGHGLDNLRARAAALGGALRLESQIGSGTRLVLTLPLLDSSPP